MALDFDPRLYVITDTTVARGRDQVALVESAIAGGATMVQLRDKGTSAADLYALGRRLRDLTRARRTAFICNDRIDLALAIDADGVHLGQDDLPPSVARMLMGHGRVVGVSTGNPTEYDLVRREGADYVGVGPYAASGSKDDAGTAIGAPGIRAVREITNLPLVAIGGISPANAAAAVAAGADGVAVIAAVFASDDVAGAARGLRDEVDRALTLRP